MCSFLIIANLPVFLSKSKAWKDFIAYVGTIAGIMAIAVPYWFIGHSILSLEYLRFYFCHSLLYITSLLPVILKLHKLEFKNFWKMGLFFIFGELIILVDNLACQAIIHPNDSKAIFEAVYNANPIWMMKPPTGFAFYTKVMEFLSPKIFLGGADKYYVPILWNAIPIYLGITIIGFIFGISFDNKGFKELFNKNKRPD